MNVRPKTRRRLMVLLIAAVALTVVLSVLVVTQLQRYERHRQALRAAGMDAYLHGDYHAASENLAKYLGNDRVDSQAIFAYAVSQKNMPRLDMGNLLDAQQLFKRYLELNNGDPAAEHQLLEIYQKLHYTSEITTLTDQLLAQNPDDVPALSAKLQQLVHDLKFTAALPISMRLNDLAPNDLRAQETTYFLMSRLGSLPPQLIARADGMLKLHPKDPRYELLRAVAAYFANDLNGAMEWLRNAASRSPPDADFTLILVSDFDRMRMWGDSLDLLKRVDAVPKAPVAVKAALAQRLWEFHQFNAALALLKNVNPQDPASESQLIGLQALVLHDRPGNTPQMKAEFQADLKCLQGRPDDMVATGWALLLPAISADVSGDATPPLQQCVDAAHADPDNPDSRFYLAEQYDQLGESEMALQCLRQTIQMQPEWPAPYLEIARMVRLRGQPFDAITPATAACERDEKSFDAQKMLAEAQYEQLGQNASTLDTKPVLNAVEQLRAAAPLDPDLLATDVDLLARSDRKTDAGQLALVAMEKPGTPFILRRLASLDRADHLGITAALVDRAGKMNATTPDQAAELFGVFVDTGNIERATAMLPQMKARATRGWRLAWLQARDEIADPGVGADWELFADSLPDSLGIQRAALLSPAVAANRALMDRTIDRLRKLTGDDAIQWRLARARWLLDATDDAKDHANAAAELMTEVARVCPEYAEPRVILGDALAKVGDFNGAIAAVQAARNLEPQDPHISLKLAGLLVHQGMIQQATILLDGIENSPRLNPVDRVEAARLYRDAGNSHRAIELLKDAQPMHPDECPRDVLLAQLLAEHGDHAAAQNIYDQWLMQPAPPEELIQAAAWYSASQGMMDRARKQLSRLNSQHLPAEESELVLADFEAAFGTPASATPHFENAAKAAPTHPQIWLHWSAMHLRKRDFLETVKIAARGLKNVPGNQQLMAMNDRALFMSSLQLDANAQPLIDVLAANPMSDAGVAMLSAIHDSQAAHENSDALAERFRALTMQWPRFLPAVDWLVALDCAAGRFDAAASAAAHARDILPAEPKPARLLSEIWSTAGRWDDALSAATDWRSRTLDHPQAADVAIATAQIELGRSASAIDQLSPYLSAAIASPSLLNDSTIELTARALCMLNHVEQAWRMMQPLTARSADWRRRWLQIVAGTTKDSVSVSERIEQVGANIPANAIADQLSLGNAWLTAGVRLNDPDLLNRAESVAMALTDSASAPADAWLLLGSVQLQLETLPEAESALAKAVQLAPEKAEAKHLLATVKLLRNEDLSTAQKLAADAVAASPENGAYHTTLGEADERLKDLDSAKTQFRIALQLNPQNAEALICLAGVQDRSGQNSEATLTLAHAEMVLQASHPTLSAPVQNELQRLRDIKGKPAASAAVDQKR